MVSLGRWNCFEEFAYNGGRLYEFLPRSDLEFISSSRSHLELKPILCVTQGGYVDGLDLRLQHDIHDPQPDAPPLHEREEAYRLERCDESRFRHVLSYLTGIHPAARASAFATIESWIADGERNALSDLVQE